MGYSLIMFFFLYFNFVAVLVFELIFVRQHFFYCTRVDDDDDDVDQLKSQRTLINILREFVWRSWWWKACHYYTEYLHTNVYISIHVCMLYICIYPRWYFLIIVIVAGATHNDNRVEKATNETEQNIFFWLFWRDITTTITTVVVDERTLHVNPYFIRYTQIIMTISVIVLCPFAIIASRNDS